MITLPNGCWCSGIPANAKKNTPDQLSVSPKKWNDPNLSERAAEKLLAKDWYIHYRFYDPAHVDKYPKGKQRIIKGMNEEKTIEARRSATKKLMSLELHQLKELGYNHITLKYQTPVPDQFDISPDTLFVDALQEAFNNGGFEGRTKTDIKSMLNYISKAAILLRYDYLSIKDVKRKHIKILLKKCEQIKDKWSNNTYNAYRKYLSILFEELVEYEAAGANPVKSLKKKKHAPKPAKAPTPEECKAIDDFTKTYDIRFNRLIHIFFHSGARTTEIFRVQGEHVNLKKQVVKYLILKGRNYHWIERPIKNIALPLWEKAMDGCGPKDYVFSKDLQPGPKKIDAAQVTRRWKRHIKGFKKNGKLELDCNWYALKHLNTTQVVDALDEQAAARLNGHTSTKMVAKVYDLNNETRKQERIKKVGNSFA